MAGTDDYRNQTSSEAAPQRTSSDDLPGKKMVHSKYLYVLSEELAREWKQVGRNLNLTEAELYNMEAEHRFQQEITYQMLLKWSRKNGKDATYRKLADALDKAKRRDLQYKPSSSETAPQRSSSNYSPGEKEVDSNFLLELSKKLSSEWKQFGRNLGLSESELDTIEANDSFQRNYYDSTLLTWSRKNGKDATYRKLEDALSKTKRWNAMEETFRYFTPTTQELVSSELSSNDSRYSMTQNPRGHCLILTYDKFDDNLRKPRDGNAVDRGNLVKLFRDVLKFTVHDKLNLNKDDTMAAITEMAHKEHKDCFVCFVCSHGDGEYFVTADNKEIKHKDLFDSFKTKNCPGLNGKPKLFFINTCLGKDKQMFEFDADVQLVPPEGDFFFAYSTLPGYASIRDTVTGTYYVQNLYKCFLEHHKTKHVADILTDVRRSVNDQLVECNVRLGDKRICQVSETTSRLLKDVYFPPV